MTRTDFFLALIASIAIAVCVYIALFAPRTSDKAWDEGREAVTRNMQPRGPQ